MKPFRWLPLALAAAGILAPPTFARIKLITLPVRERVEIHFHHLKAFTKGMHVVWTFRDAPGGVLVEIMHDLIFRVNLLAPIADKIIGDFFIHNIASKTLRCMKAYVEAKANKVAT